MTRDPSAQPRPPALPPLTSLRFFAALAVVLCHSDRMANSPWLKRAYGTFFREGYSGVSFFFVLSGFVLAYGYADRLRSLSPASVWEFGKARFARIYPLHLFMLLSTIVVYPLCRSEFRLPHALDASPAFFANLTLTQSLFSNGQIHFGYNGPSWSLSVEAFFYLTFPLTIWFLTRRFWGSRRALFPALAALLWLAQCQYVKSVCATGSPKMGWACHVLPLGRWPEFAIGVVLGLWFSARRPITRETGWKWIWTLAEAGCLALLGTCIYFRDHIPPFWHTPSAYAPVFCLLILIAARQGGHLTSLLAWKPLVFLGEASFALYLVHGMCITLLWGNFGLRLTNYLGLCTVISVAAAIAASCLVHVAIERPARRACLAVARRRPQAPVAKDLKPMPLSRAA